jgi:hypothetical protein
METGMAFLLASVFPLRKDAWNHPSGKSIATKNQSQDAWKFGKTILARVIRICATDK